jgi:choice-of-anchor B domain-containing protein
LKRFAIVLISLQSFIFYLEGFAQNLSFVGRLRYPTSQLSSLWGYTDELGREYALVGTTKGFSIVDISNPATPKQLHFIPGSPGTWREVKTFRHYAYVSHDNSNNGEGLLIIDLKNLRDTVVVKDFRGQDGNLRRAHTLYIDSLGYMYLFGGTSRGCAIYHLNNDPMNPEFVGITSDEYIHDGYVRGDTLWAANVYAGYISVWDLSDRANPVKLTQFFTPMKFSHNAWLSDNGKTIFTTDERESAPVAAYNIEDVYDPKLIDTWKRRANEKSIPHNVHVLNDYVIISHYTEGVVILDGSDPRKMVRTGQYDTSPGFSGGGFNGCWGVYPYFKSGLIIASDIEGGLYILRPTYIRAGRLFGNVYDAETLQPINNAFVRISDGSDSCTTNFDGDYKLGRLNAGLVTISFSANGYVSKDITRGFANGFSDTLNVFLERLTTNVDQNSKEDWALVTPIHHSLQINNLSGEPITFTLFSSAGSVIIGSRQLSAGLHTIDWSFLPAGIYHVQLSGKSGFLSKQIYKN